ncbi:patatin-like phospholipase family protein [Caenispirillum bisanense]|uniref:patatin-like phospholipase family protein n=1 Tax=Caenispirillum bisanense TaxID=414052 RepID=UPI0031D4F4D2
MAIILSIDGGGIRGLIPALVLEEIEKRLNAKVKGLTTDFEYSALVQKAGAGLPPVPLARAFDLIAGTSTGGIIAAGLTCPKPGKDSVPAMTAADLVRLYETEGPEIFPPHIFRRIIGMVDESYSEKPLETKLKRYLGDGKLSQAHGAVLITAYDIEARRTVFMKGAGPRQHPKPRPYSDYYFRDAARGTSAAPTFFEPEPVTDLTKNEVRILIDGGVFNNDPAMSAYVEALKLGYPEEEIVIVSLGTGVANTSYEYDKVRSWGPLSWVSPLLDKPIISIMMQGQADVTGNHLKELLNDSGKEDRYIRLDPELKGKASDAMDNASPKNLKRLRSVAEELIKAESKTIDRIVGLIAANAQKLAGAPAT